MISLATIESQETIDYERFFDEAEIDGFCIDLDDCLIKTDPIFKACMNQFHVDVCARLGIDPEEFHKISHEVNTETHGVCAVNPNRWEYYLNRLGERYQQKDVFMSYLDHFAGIYAVKPELHPGALEFLDSLKVGGRQICIVTNANLGWTWKKLYETGIARPGLRVVIADENGHKSPEHWLEAADLLSVPPERALSMGDSVKGDIVASAIAGFKHRVLLPASWAYYGVGDVPEGTIVMPDHRLDTVVPALMSHLGWNSGN